MISLLCGIFFKKKTQRNLFTKQKQTHRHRKQISGYQKGKGGGKLGITDQEIHTTVCEMNKVLLYSKGNYIQYLVITYVCAKMLQSCLTLCDPMDYSLPGSSVHGILQAKILEWVAMPSSRGSSRPRDQF